MDIMKMTWRILILEKYYIVVSFYIEVIKFCI